MASKYMTIQLSAVGDNPLRNVWLSADCIGSQKNADVRTFASRTPCGKNACGGLESEMTYIYICNIII